MEVFVFCGNVSGTLVGMVWHC